MLQPKIIENGEYNYLAHSFWLLVDYAKKEMACKVHYNEKLVDNGLFISRPLTIILGAHKRLDDTVITLLHEMGHVEDYWENRRAPGSSSIPSIRYLMEEEAWKNAEVLLRDFQLEEILGERFNFMKERSLLSYRMTLKLF